MPDDKKKRRRFLADIQIGGGALDIGSLRSLAQNEPDTFMLRVQGLIDKGELRLEDVTDLRRLWQAFADVKVPATFDDMGTQRTIMSSAFALLSGGLIVAGVNDAYEAVPTIGQELVTEREDNKKISTYAAITSLDVEVDNLLEAAEAPEIGAGEEKYTIAHRKNGRRLSITKEMIEENDIAGIVTKVNALAEIANERVEEQTLRRVCDIDGSDATPAEPYVFHPDGTGTRLYNSTADNPGTRAPSGTRVDNNALVDYTDLENARAVLAAMQNSRGKRISIPVSQSVLLVPDAIVGVAQKILNSEYTPGIENEINTWGPRGSYRPKLLSSPKLDDLSTSAWYFGRPQKQFIRKWKMRFEYNTLGENTESYLRALIVFQASLFWDVEIGATDYVYFVQSLQAATAPAA